MLRNKKMLNKRFFILLSLIVSIGLFFFLYPKNSINKQQVNQNKDISQESPKIVSTKPEPLDNSVIPAQGAVEVTFNRPLENIGEFKVKIEPEIKFKTELSGDRKTAKIIPEEPYQLGTTYTLFIGPETKFDGVGRWGEEKIFHFKTIPYKGV